MTIFEQAARAPRKHPVLFHGATALLIVVLSLIIYTKTFKYAYLDWDDNTLVEQNVYVMQPGAKFPTADLWTPGRTPGPYQPLRTWSYIVDRDWFGKDEKSHEAKANWHHIVNTWLYIVNGLVLFAALRKLLDPWTAAIAALIWVVHPLHVEGVSWVSGRKEMLAGVLMVASFLFYVLAAEKRERARPGIPFLVGSVLVSAVGMYVLVRWIPIANSYNLQSRSWIVGFVALLILLAGILVTCLQERKHLFRVIFFSLAAFLCGVFALLSKPVAIMLPAILVAWELGHRPLREREMSWSGRLGTYGVLAGLTAVFAGFAFAYVRHVPIPGAATRAILCGAAVFAAGYAVEWSRPKLPEVWRNRLQALLDRVPVTDEALGMLVRSLPFICITLWGVGSIMSIASEGSVVKEATWNAAPKSRSVSAFAAIWLDLYHMFVPLNLSSLYDVKSDVWHWQAVVGVVILIATPFAALWTYARSPKSLVWLAWLIAPIIPVSGIVQIAAAHADRYLYLPTIAVAVGLAYLLSTAAFGSDEETGAWERWVAAGLTIAIVGGFTALSSQRADVWRNDVALWGDAVKKNPRLPSALNNYGAALMNDRQVEKALEQYYKAYEVLPTLDVAQFNIAATELRLGRPDKAQRYAEEFVAQHPEMPTGWILLGQLYLKQQRGADQAGNAELAREKLAKAIDAYQKGCDVPVAETQPLQLQDKASACGHLATVLNVAGNTTGMELAFQKGFAVSRVNRSLVELRLRVLREQKRFAEAHELLETLPMTVENLRRIVQNLIAMDDKKRALEYMETILRSRGAQASDVAVKQRIEEAIKDNKPVDLTVKQPQAVPQDLSPIELQKLQSLRESFQP